MTTLIALLQLTIIALCVWGELARNVRRSSPVSTALGVIAMSALIGLAKGGAGLAAVLLWLIVLAALVALLRWASHRNHHRRLHL